MNKLSSSLREKVFINHSLKKNLNYKYIIVSRSRSSRRKLINEHDLLVKLKPYKFKLVYFEDYDYNSQINIARNCKIMIGYHGAGLTNLFFMKSSSRVVEIFNKNYKNEIYEVFSKALRLNYKSFICDKNYQNLDGICDVNEILNYIKKII